MFLQEKKSNFTQIWKQNYFTYHLALNYFKKKIDRHSPCKIYETSNRYSKYYKCGIKIDPYIVNNKFLEESDWKGIDIETLPIYENASKVENLFNLQNIEQEDEMDTSYKMHFIYDGHRRKYTLKRINIIKPCVYTKYILLKTYFESFSTYEKNIILKELINQLEYIGEEELIYMNMYGFDDMNDIIFHISNMYESAFSSPDSGEFSDNLMKLYNFYKYICLFNIITSFSLTNNNIHIMYICNQLVLDKKSPSFSLIYSSFKTNDPFIFDNFNISINRTLKNLCKKCFDDNIYPSQYIAYESSDMSLRELLQTSYFNYRMQDFQKICKRYLVIYAQIIFALFTAQKTYGYVNNNLTVDNIMVKLFTGSLYYSIHEDELNYFNDIFPSDRFIRNKRGYVIFKLKTDVGICKITNHEQASIQFAPSHSKLSRISSIENLFEFQNNELPKYDHENFNNDLLKFFIDLYDENFFDILFRRHERGISSKLERQIIDINEQVFYCKNDDDDIFEVMGECQDDEECKLIFNKFGMYGFGQEPVCDIKRQRIPDTLIKHFYTFSRPKTKLKSHKLCFKMV